jgi:hypothetical protein
MNLWLALKVFFGIADSATKGKRIVVGKGDNVIVDLDRLPAGDPGHDVDPRPRSGILKLFAVVWVAALMSTACGFWVKVIDAVPQPPVVTPVPTPVPVPTPTPTPPPVVVPPPVVTPPPAAQFPVRFPRVGVRVYSNNHKYGNGLDGTPRIGSSGDPELCEALHHVPVPRGDCHFDSDVWGGDTVLRGRYEMWVLAGARDGQPLPAAPLGLVWEYKSGPERGRCHDDRVSAAVSCDHFGNAATRDDPNTPEFEGLPAELGAQRDAYGPYAGFFTMPQCPHTPADFGPDGRLLSSAPECSVRSCPPLAEEEDSACGPWVEVTWK